MARPSKYAEFVKPRLKEIEKWRKNGATVEQISAALGIKESTFYTYVNKYLELKEVYKKGTFELCQDLRGELARIALPHEIKTAKMYTTTDEDGGIKKHTEITKREVDGDIAAINLLLKNLDENWANDPQMLELKKQEIELKKELARANNFDIDI